MIDAALTLGLSGFVAGLCLLYASKKFLVEKDPRIGEINELLPGANCGGCGLPGCLSLAEAIVSGKVPPNACPVGGNDSAQNIANYLGLNVEISSRKAARMRCRGDALNCPDKYEYEGPFDCSSIVMLAGGTKLCTYGCVGGGSCVRVCQFFAIQMGENNLPIVDEDACTACGMCAKTCPRSLIEILPIDKLFVVNCRSFDKGIDTKNICKVGCIGCKLCQKNCPENAIEVENNLAVIVSEKCINCGKCMEVCPTKSIGRYA